MIKLADQIRVLSKLTEAYKYSSVQISLPYPHATEIYNWGLKNIPDIDLASEEGREDDIHVTIKYGLHSHNWENLRPLLMKVSPFDIKLGPLSIFQNDKHDVVKISIESPELIRLNKIISASLEHTDTHPSFIPHCTLAYVKAGLGKKYEGDQTFNGRIIRINSVTFSGNDNFRIELPLK